jgi:hypothetical protein
MSIHTHTTHYQRTPDEQNLGVDDEDEEAFQQQPKKKPKKKKGLSAD